MFQGRNNAQAPRSTIDDPFAGIDGADTTGQRNPYLLQGQYILRVQRVSHLRSRDGKLFFLTELEIVASDNPERPEGLVVTWMTNMLQDMGPINSKRFLAAVLGYDPEGDEANTEITAQVARVACSETNPLKGRQVRAQADNVKTRAGTDFLAVKWTPYGEAA